MSKEIELLRKIRNQDYLCDSLRAEIDSLLNPPIVHYSQWKKGDLLRVIDRDKDDVAQIGDIVTHNDTDGSVAPWCLLLDGSENVCMAGTELEFVERPE